MDTQTPITDASAGEGNAQPEVGSELVSKLEEVSGRKFKDFDDFSSHYKNLSSFVGKKTESEEKLTTILNKVEPFAKKVGVSPEEYINFYLDNPSADESQLQETVKKQREDRILQQKDEELRKVSSKTEELEFLVNHPEYKKKLDFIKTVAKGKGCSLEEAISDPNVMNVLNSEREQEGLSVINSNQKITAANSDVLKARQKAIKSGADEDIVNYLIQSGQISQVDKD